jgi:hypothetical protein
MGALDQNLPSLGKPRLHCQLQKFTIRMPTQLRSQGKKLERQQLLLTQMDPTHSDRTLTMTLDLLDPHNCSRTHCNIKDMIYQAMHKQIESKKLVENNYHIDSAINFMF